MSSGTTECPICFETFSTSVVTVHASSCTGTKPKKIGTPTRTGNASAKDAGMAKKRPLASPVRDDNAEQGRKDAQNGGAIDPNLEAEGSPPPSKKRLPSNSTTSNGVTPTVENINNSSAKMTKPTSAPLTSPLADHCRPTKLDEIIGQDDVTGDSGFWGSVLSADGLCRKMPSMILWGPPGCGKTSLANVIASKCKADGSTRFVRLSACTSGVSDVKDVVAKARNEKRSFKRSTVLFVDEVHRFNKTQQDTFLPHIEDGTITFLGATTENPSFSLNKALLSRCKTVVLSALSSEALTKILVKAVDAYNSTITNCVKVKREALEFLASSSNGDARSALNCLELVMGRATSSSRSVEAEVGLDEVREASKRGHLPYDKKGDDHYHCASALQKSIRGSDDTAALYWTVRMLEGGEDPLFIGRRLVRIAAEDVGLGDPQALPMAVAAMQGCQLIGRPECDVILAECAVYLARAKKSHEVYHAWKEAKEHLYKYEGGNVPPVPLILRNPTSKLDRDRGYRQGYSYDLEEAKKISYLPEGIDFNPFGKK